MLFSSDHKKTFSTGDMTFNDDMFEIALLVIVLYKKVQ